MENKNIRIIFELIITLKEADTSTGSDENRPHEVDNSKMEVDGEGNAVKIEVIGLKELEVSTTTRVL